AHLFSPPTLAGKPPVWPAPCTILPATTGYRGEWELRGERRGWSDGRRSTGGRSTFRPPRADRLPPVRTRRTPRIPAASAAPRPRRRSGRPPRHAGAYFRSRRRAWKGYRGTGIRVGPPRVTHCPGPSAEPPTPAPGYRERRAAPWSPLRTGAAAEPFSVSRSAPGLPAPRDPGDPRPRRPAKDGTPLRP